jgi:hypothetical protein
MRNGLTNSVFVIAFIGACALAQDQEQPRAVASISEISAENAPSASSLGQGFESRDGSLVDNQPSPYFWKSAAVGASAQLLTLFCRACGASAGTEQDAPLLAALRDTLGDQATENDRVTYVWLLTYAHPRVRQRIFSAIPFFYWRVSKGSGSVSKHDTAPFMDLSAPENPMMLQVSRNLLQSRKGQGSAPSTKAAPAIASAAKNAAPPANPAVSQLLRKTSMGLTPDARRAGM